MDGFDRDPDTKVAHLLGRIRPGWDAARTERNLATILERLKGQGRWRRSWDAMLAATRLRYRNP